MHTFLSKKKESDILNDGTVLRVTTDEKWGTIFTSTGEKIIEAVTPKGEAPKLTASEISTFNEEDYFEKLRAKATSMASQILADARAQAETLVQEAQA